MDRQIELKPCPFCGGLAKIKCVGKGNTREQLGVIVRCINCECGTAPCYPLPHFSYKAREETVINQWNRRANNG